MALQSELGHSTAEKQRPNALMFLADFKQAICLERRMTKPGGKNSIKDMVRKVSAEYNRICTQKQHRVDSQKQQLVYNMFLGTLVLVTLHRD